MESTQQRLAEMEASLVQTQAEAQQGAQELADTRHLGVPGIEVTDKRSAMSPVQCIYIYIYVLLKVSGMNFVDLISQSCALLCSFVGQRKMLEDKEAEVSTLGQM